MAFLRTLLRSARICSVAVVDRLVSLRLCGCLRLPRLVAVVLTLCAAAALLGGLALVVADSVREFSARAGEYTKHVQVCEIQCRA